MISHCTARCWLAIAPAFCHECHLHIQWNCNCTFKCRLHVLHAGRTNCGCSQCWLPEKRTHSYGNTPSSSGWLTYWLGFTPLLVQFHDVSLLLNVPLTPNSGVPITVPSEQVALTWATMEYSFVVVIVQFTILPLHRASQAHLLLMAQQTSRPCM